MAVPSTQSLNSRSLFTQRLDNAHDFVSSIFQADPGNYTLFRPEDLQAWTIFAAVFAGLIIFDQCILNKSSEELTVQKAVGYTMFWIFTACAFCGWVFVYFGPDAAFSWMSGYLLEWMLSFDNLFVFHLIFSVYGTPEHLKHRPLYLGICGAVFFRLAFLFVGEYLMHTMVFMHFIFGGFLIYTGVKTMTADDDDEDPSQNALVQWLQGHLPMISFYDKSGAFFVKVPVDEHGQLASVENTLMAPTSPSASKEVPSFNIDGASYGTLDMRATKSGSTAEPKKWQVRATMLFLVVCCLEISDMLFAVDSVSAIVAQVNDLFLAYTSAVFAMLGLRATFFIIDVLVHMFSLLKYGVALVLIFIGIKLCLSHIYPISPGIVVLVLVFAIGGSMAASVVQDMIQRKAAGENFEDVIERVEKVKSKSPTITEKTPQQCA
eukprot:TRINITY_DN12508_c0_g1_i1.p1 TRINITY_DN12508_c0_g1~~TRINITY_DN12508_c0_g1_i1.p1  ORF type:complete len:434 (-),score=108.58 TRINITY_DN12508_c0_g1_i1:112-1413(-)